MARGQVALQGSFAGRKYILEILPADMQSHLTLKKLTLKIR
jgi:hypothetical protein